MHIKNVAHREHLFVLAQIKNTVFDVSQRNMIKVKGLMLHSRHLGHGRDIEAYLCHYFQQSFAEEIELLQSNKELFSFRNATNSSVMHVQWGNTAGPPGTQAAGTDLRAAVVAHRH